MYNLKAEMSNSTATRALFSSRIRHNLQYYHYSPFSHYSSISSIRSSPSREESGATWTAFTVPLMGEFTTISIFMAERTHSG